MTNLKKLVALLVLALITLNSVGCATEKAYWESVSEGNEKSFFGWLLTPKWEMDKRDLARAEGLKYELPPGESYARGHAGIAGAGSLDESFGDGHDYDYEYRDSVGVGAGVRIQIRPAPDRDRRRDTSYEPARRKGEYK